LRGYAAGRRASVRSAKTPRPKRTLRTQTCDDRSRLPNRQPPLSCGTSR
jgi:hypothetical protein